jgi:antitoxin CcdA
MNSFNSQSDRSKKKRAVNLSLSADVLDAAKALNINVSRECDAQLRLVVKKEQEARWKREHAEFIAAYNTVFEAEGLPLDEWRSF